MLIVTLKHESRFAEGSVTEYTLNQGVFSLAPVGNQAKMRTRAKLEIVGRVGVEE